MGAAFLGLTVGCARCHDHKFDPISQRDYYRMNAIFAGSVEREIPLVSLFDIQTASRNFPLLNQAQILKQMAAAAAVAAAAASRRTRRAGQAQVNQTDAHRRRSRRRAARPAAVDPQRAALLQQLGEAYLRAPEHYPTANVLAHEEVVPDTHILVRRATSRTRARRWSPASSPRSTPGRRSSSRRTSSSFRSAAKRSRSG